MSAIDRRQRKRTGGRRFRGQRFRYSLANIKKKTKHQPGAYIIRKGNRGYHGASGDVKSRLTDEYYTRGDMRQVEGKSDMVDKALDGGELEVHYTKTKDDAHQLERELGKSRKMKPLVPPKSGNTNSGSTWA
jgi:hypothetical protein